MPIAAAVRAPEPGTGGMRPASVFAMLRTLTVSSLGAAVHRLIRRTSTGID
jgi:hypothetical protein